MREGGGAGVNANLNDAKTVAVVMSLREDVANSLARMIVSSALPRLTLGGRRRGGDAKLWLTKQLSERQS